MYVLSLFDGAFGQGSQFLQNKTPWRNHSVVENKIAFAVKSGLGKKSRRGVGLPLNTCVTDLTNSLIIFFHIYFFILYQPILFFKIKSIMSSKTK